MDNCWLSPDGEVYYCDLHSHMAKYLVEQFYPDAQMSTDSGMYIGPERYLESKGWIKYVLREWHVGWVFSQYGRRHRTQAQIDKIYELTGEVINVRNP
jgi:hypothetical protein